MDFLQIVYLAICIYHEARGEPFDGQVAVGHVILNRLEKTNKSVKDVVLKPYQFSWANNGVRPSIKDYDMFAGCINAAMSCVFERLEGKNLNGADHYYADYIAEPSWAKSMNRVVKIGRHIFFKS